MTHRVHGTAVAKDLQDGIDVDHLAADFDAKGRRHAVQGRKVVNFELAHLAVCCTGSTCILMLQAAARTEVEELSTFPSADETIGSCGSARLIRVKAAGLAKGHERSHMVFIASGCLLYQLGDHDKSIATHHSLAIVRAGETHVN